MLPGALRALTAAPDDKEAGRLGTWIERILLSVAGPCEGCTPVAAVLVAALPEMTPPGHSVALELLSQLSAAEITGPAHEQIGAVDAEEIRQAVAGRGRVEVRLPDQRSGIPGHPPTHSARFGARFTRNRPTDAQRPTS